jgi:hypothetical protein
MVRVLAVAALALFAAGCGAEPLPPIRQQGAWLVVENQTRRPWKNVTVTLNSYYRATSPALLPGGRLEAPLANFETGLGHRFDTAREHVQRVEVRATDGAGQPLALDWDEKTDKPLALTPGREK